MKLYATVTSERATKGQGGNEYLEIKVQAGSQRATLGTITTHQSHGNVAIYTLYVGDDKVGEIIDTKCPCDKCGGRTKGKQQKGECKECGQSNFCPDCEKCVYCSKACKNTVDSHNA